MRIFLSIIIGAIVVILISAERRITADEGEAGSMDIVIPVGLGCLVGLIDYFIPFFKAGTNVAWMAPCSMALMLGVYAYLVYRWCMNGSGWKEMIPYVLTAVFCFLVTQATAIMTATLISNTFLLALVMALPLLVLVGSVGFFVANLFYFRYKELGRGSDDRLCFAIVTIVTSIIAILILVSCFSAKWDGFKDILNMVENINANTVSEKSLETSEGVTSEEPDSAVDVASDELADEALALLGEMLDEGSSLEEYDVDAATVTEVATEATTETKSKPKSTKSKSKSKSKAKAEQPAIWYRFYNLDLSLDADPRNDFDFGPNPYEKGLTAEDYDAELRERMSEDVALTAGDVAWIDAIVGTRYLGKFYESCKGDWAETINASKEAWMADQGAFYQTLNAVFAFMDKAESVTLDYQTSGLDDQMYMNPYTVDSVPDVVVMTTTDHTGYFLTYHFLIKGQEFKVAYRIDCGYQPTNVEKVMKIKPDDTPRTAGPTGTSVSRDPRPSGGKDSQPKGGSDDPTPKPNPNPDPTPKPTPKPDPDPDPDPNPNPNPDPDPDPNPDPEPGPKPTPKPDPDPDPTPIHEKDPTEGTHENTEPTDDDGLGPDTNNPSDPQHSTEDQPYNSDHYDDYDDYEAEIEHLEEVNETQRTNEDDSTPTVHTSPETHIDDNSDTGNGGAPIDDPTPVTAPAIEADTGREIDDTPGEAWEGPMD